MIRKTLTLALLCAAALCAPAPGWTQDTYNARRAMADAMVRMMEIMGLFGGGSLGSWGGVPNVSGLTSPFGSWMGMPGASPWGMPFQDPSKATGWGSNMMSQMAQGVPGASTGSGTGAEPLDGVWEGGGGDLLIVQGGRYRIYAPQDQYIDGMLQQQSNRVALFNAQDGQTQIFDFATQDGRLALRGAGGEVYLYRRFGGMPAGRGPTMTAPAPEPQAPAATTPEPSTPLAPRTSGAR